MSDPTSTETSSTTGSTAGTADWRAQRRAEKHARRDAWRQGRHDWAGMPVGGVIIIAVGVIFLAGNFGLHLPQNWWAIFVLLPAAAALVSAARFYRIDGALNSRVVGSATGGVLLLAVALALFLGVNWAIFWPVLLIIVGAGIVARGYWRRG